MNSKAHSLLAQLGFAGHDMILGKQYVKSVLGHIGDTIKPITWFVVC